ncbi:MAG: SAM-dependent methyltransferase [Pirellulaceae bacterium]|jgi:SAM-dependent methyltransferase
MAEQTTVNTSEAFDQWKSKAQVGELEFHVREKARPNADMYLRDREIFEAFGFTAEQFQGETVVDLGAGSHLRTKFFQGAKIAAIEPLGDQYRANIEWCDLSDAEYYHSIPAEQRVETLGGMAAFANCMNVLDHAFEPERILSNVNFYLRPGGIFLLSVDLHDGQADDLHPVDLDIPRLRQLIYDAGFSIDRAFLYLPRAKSYGHGFACSFVLRKSDAPTAPAKRIEFCKLRTSGQLVMENVNRRVNSIGRRIHRILSGESRGLRKLLGRAA